MACVGMGLSFFRSKQKQQIRSMLRKAEAIARRAALRISSARANRKISFSKFLRRFQFMERLDLMLEQAGKNWSGSKLIMISCVSCGAGLLLGLKLHLVSP